MKPNWNAEETAIAGKSDLELTDQEAQSIVGGGAIRITNVRADALSAPPASGQFIPATIQ